ncbi:protocatechuate 3,4-dioxygenase beta subunit [Pedobacter steynii]|uniref:Protocatechuate 3,4-dioxygenase beta subunit n=1 Tax=Pedobacter steynii TaxID=430522 RepID=A0A1G9Z7U6_9SPHI|nr:hypothetical protein [Pedobacter steynii]NQX39979.1 intradiol ring-cleavage dioxygenase [Pedobacter steynii]SDN17492.1 protocatechuate 3,4-dioxygenase beta subunit [Pedobacter steynii]
MKLHIKSNYLALILTILTFSSCKGQAGKNNPVAARTQTVGGGCDGCELMYIGMPKQIKPTDTSAGWTEKGQKLLISGRAFKPDGKSPAPDVIIYYWQTDSKGYYSPGKGMDKRTLRHGHIRGWVKTDQQGRYAIYTIRPATYPDRSEPAHIHTSIKEPGIDTEYYIDEFVFDDDPLLNAKKRKALENRGGSGILKTSVSGNLQIAKHNIRLGLHIPNYPAAPH